MADRTYARDQYNGDNGCVTLFASVAFNSSSAPSLLTCALGTGIYTVAPAGGVAHFKSFTRASTGNYTLTLRDKFVRLLGVNVLFLGSANAAAPIAQVKLASDPNAAQAFGSAVGAGTVRSGTSSINILTFSAQGTAADPAATEMAIIELVLQNSTAN